MGVSLKSKKTKQAGDGKAKRKKVVKTRLPLALIEKLVATPYTNDGIPDDRLAKARRAKMMAYRQAIINQYNDKGYVEDESEVTDDEE
nr:unnamed protein product [Digitaria exilis]